VYRREVNYTNVASDAVRYVNKGRWWRGCRIAFRLLDVLARATCLDNGRVDSSILPRFKRAVLIKGYCLNLGESEMSTGFKL